MTRCKHDMDSRYCADCAAPVRRRPEPVARVNAWTEEQLLFLVENYGSITAAEIGVVVGRTDDAVRSMAAVIEQRGWVTISREQGKLHEAELQAETLAVARNHREEWDAGEDDVVLGTGTAFEKALELGRTLYAVRDRAEKLRELVTA